MREESIIEREGGPQVVSTVRIGDQEATVLPKPHERRHSSACMRPRLCAR